MKEKTELKQIKKHFKNAKQIKCLRLKTIIDVTYLDEYVYDESTNSYNSKGGIICFWKDGEFAEITKKKCNQCKNCNCKENE